MFNIQVVLSRIAEFESSDLFFFPETSNFLKSLFRKEREKKTDFCLQFREKSTKKKFVMFDAVWYKQITLTISIDQPTRFFFFFRWKLFLKGRQFSKHHNCFCLTYCYFHPPPQVSLCPESKSLLFISSTPDTDPFAKGGNLIHCGKRVGSRRKK